MITPELVSFVKGEVARGETRESIRNKLITQGWSDTDVMEAFNSASSPVAPLITPVTPTFSPISQNEASPSASIYEPRSHKKLFLIGSLVLIILIIGSGFAYVSGYFTPQGKLFSSSVASTAKAKSVTFDTDVIVDVSGLKESTEASNLLPGMSPVFNFNMKGSYDDLDKGVLKSTGSFSATSGTVAVGIDMRIIDKVMYLKLNKAPVLPFISLEPYENKWVSIPLDPSALSNNPIMSPLGVSQNPLSNLTDAQKKYLTDLTSNAHFINITARHLPEIIDGTLAFHFDFDLDRAGIIAYIKDVVEYTKTIDMYKEKYSYMTPSDSDFDNMFKGLTSFHGEAWVGSFNHLPYKILLNMEVTNPDMPSDGIAKIGAKVEYKDWNKPVVIEAPKDSVKLEELISSAMGGMMGDLSAKTPEPSQDDNIPVTVGGLDPLTSARIKATKAQIESIHASMRMQAEAYYDSNNYSYKGFCTSKGASGAYVLAKGLPKNTIYKCNDSSESWAAWSKLSTGDYACSDSTGFANKPTTLPKGTSCPGDRPIPSPLIQLPSPR